MARIFDLIDDFSITQGKSYNKPISDWIISHSCDIDLSAWTPRASIRADYKDRLPTEKLVDFDFDPLVVFEGKLLIHPYLPVSKTLELSPTIYQDKVKQLKTPYCYVWDLEIYNQAEDVVISIIETSLVRVKHEVT
jgi:hypothetical protein